MKMGFRYGAGVDVDNQTIKVKNIKKELDYQTN
jgi:hypothetical protein